MDSVVTSIIIVSLITLIVILFLNTRALRQMVRKPMERNELNDGKYWELYYKVQSQQTIFAIIVGVTAFLGYTTKKDIEDNVKNDLQPQINQVKKQIGSLDSSVRVLSDTATFLSDTITGSRNEFYRIKKELSSLKSKDILKQPIYIINRRFTTDEIYDSAKANNAQNSITLSYSKLHTISNGKLPSFKRIPSIFGFSTTGGELFLRTYIDRVEISTLNLGSIGEEEVLTLYISEVP